MKKKRKKNASSPEAHQKFNRMPSAPEESAQTKTQQSGGGGLPPARRAPLRVLLPIAILASIGVAAFLYFRSTPKLSTGQFKDYNVLLVTIDTLRADHLPAYGYHGVTTPAIDSLAAEGYVFNDAIAHVPLTLPSHVSILTGLLPLAHGVRDNGGYHMQDSDVSIAEILKANGYTTAAFVSAFVLDSTWNIDQGFDFYLDNFDSVHEQDVNPASVQRKGEETVTEAVHWLEQNSSKKFFAWVHLYDPHDPYDPPEPYKTQYASVLYDGEIAYSDAMLGRFLDQLESLKIKEKTVIIFTGDHGESLGEHGESTHGMFIYNATQHVPLIIAAAGIKEKRIDGVVRHIDVVPTIMDLLGMPESKQVQGKSLIALMNGKEKNERYAYSESLYSQIHYNWSELQSITTNDYKYIEAPRPELFKRHEDRNENQNLYKDKTSIANVLKSKLLELIGTSARAGLQEQKKMDPETEEKLRALGYLGTGPSRSGEKSNADPKDKIGIAVGVQSAAGAALIGDYPLALRLVEPVLKEEPQIVEALYLSGVAYAGMGQYDHAIDRLLKTVALASDHVMAQYNLGLAYQMKGDLKQAEYWYLKVLDASPYHISAAVKLGTVYRAMREEEKAKPYFAKAIEFYQDSLKKTTAPGGRAGLYSSLGEIYFFAGNLKDAEQSLDSAIELTPGRVSLHYNLAQIYEAKGEPLKAVQEYESELKVDAGNFRAYTNLGILYYQMKKMDDAARCFQKTIELNPREPRGYLQLAAVYKMMGRDAEAEQLLQRVNDNFKPRNE
jgi:arylsulfatase A-like enzyme/Tfp pilus assembly protein PilF